MKKLLFILFCVIDILLQDDGYLFQAQEVQ